MELPPKEIVSNASDTRLMADVLGIDPITIKRKYYFYEDEVEPVPLKVWLILDSRAWKDPDRAAVYCAYSEHENETLEDVKKDRDKEWPDGVIFEYDAVEKEGVDEIINQRLIG